MKDEAILAVYETGHEAVIKLVNTLTYAITELKERVRALEEQLNRNSRNSDLPVNRQVPKAQR
jgi:tRNA(Phe) wybutosine-synthesizing methylase Tyw3